MALSLARRPADDGVVVDGERVQVGPRGCDEVRFDVSTNPGEPLRPLAKVASGGETARIMLALKSTLGAADPVPTLIFDEIDAGIGGRVGAVVGRKLWRLATPRQVVCVTHLPQVAAYADVHLHVRKQVEGGRATTQVGRLGAADRPAELSAMLGASTAAGVESARDLLSAAADWKEGVEAVA